MTPKTVDSIQEAVDILSPKCKLLYIVPMYRKNRLGGDYIYLLHKDIIENTNGLRVKGVKDWNQFRYIFAARRDKSVVLHYNWLEVQDRFSLIRVFFSWLCLILYKHYDGKLIWSIHNRTSEVQRYQWINKKLQQWMANNSDLLRVHCRTAYEEMSDDLGVPGSRFIILPHPRFPAYLLPRTAAIEALNQRYQANLQSKNQIFLMFGNIGPHKQILEVIEIFHSLSVNKKLLIVGPVKQGCMNYYHKIKKAANEDPESFFLYPKTISANIVPEFFNAADYCLFNYKHILTSGGVELARSYQKPVIAPYMGCLKELKNNPETHLFHSQSDLIKLLTDI